MAVLVIGAFGEIAGLVVPALLERGIIVRSLVRNAEQIDLALRRSRGRGG